MASPSIVALLLARGCIAHSKFKIPLNVGEKSTCNMGKNTQLVVLIRKAELIIWDEALMDHQYCFEAVNETLKNIMLLSNSNVKEMAFGGKTILLGGNFRQILPVVEKGFKHEIVNNCINRSYLWKHCRLMDLRKNMRLDDTNLIEDEKFKLVAFAKWLLNVGDERLSTKCFDDKTKL